MSQMWDPTGLLRESSVSSTGSQVSLVRPNLCSVGPCYPFRRNSVAFECILNMWSMQFDCCFFFFLIIIWKILNDFNSVFNIFNGIKLKQWEEDHGWAWTWDGWGDGGEGFWLLLFFFGLGYQLARWEAICSTGQPSVGPYFWAAFYIWQSAMFSSHFLS